MNVLFINCVCSNSGDAAILQAATTVIRRAFGPDTEFIVQDDHPQRVRMLYPDKHFVGSCYWSVVHTELQGWRGRFVRQIKLARFRLARRLMRYGISFLTNRLLNKTEREYLEAFRSADLVVATGGTYLVENYSLDQRMFDMNTAIVMHRPLLLFTQSAGPFTCPKNRKRLRRIFRASRLVLLRENRSQMHVRDLNVPADRVRIAPDAAFALADDDLVDRPIYPFPLAKPRPRIAVSVRRWDYFFGCSSQEGMARYCAAFASLTTHLVRQYNADVTFLSTCQGVPRYHDDSQIASAIKASLAEDLQRHVFVDRDFHTPDDLRQRLREFDWIVATRMHVAILALGVGTPVLPIAYEFKTVELFKSLCRECDVLEIETLTPENLIIAFEKSVELYGRIGPQLQEAIDRKRLEALQVPDVFKEQFPESICILGIERSQLPRANVSADHLHTVH